MMAAQQADDRPSDKWAPIVLGAVIGLTFGGMLSVAIIGWQLWSANSAEDAGTAPAAQLSSGAYAPYSVGPSTNAATASQPVTPQGSYPFTYADSYATQPAVPLSPKPVAPTVYPSYSGSDTTPSGYVAPAEVVPAGAVPVGAVPVGAVPVGAVPVGAVPVGAVPAGAAPAEVVPAGVAPVARQAIEPVAPTGTPPENVPAEEAKKSEGILARDE